MGLAVRALHATDGTEIPKQLWKERNHEDNRKQDNVSAHRGRSRRRRRARFGSSPVGLCAKRNGCHHRSERGRQSDRRNNDFSQRLSEFYRKGRRLVPRHVLQPRYAQHRQPRLQCVSREPVRQNGEQGGPDPHPQLRWLREGRHLQGLRAMPSGPYDVDRPVLGRCYPRESLRQPAVR